MTEWRIHIADDWATILEDSLTVERGRVNRILDRLVPGGAE